MRFLKREDIAPTNDVEHAELPKLPSKCPVVLSEKEVKSLLRATPKTELGKRDQAFMTLLYMTGIRVSEACDLHVKDMRSTYLHIFGKGNVERVVPVCKRSISLIKAYWRAANRNPIADDYVFVTRNNKRIDRVTAWRLIKKYALIAGIEKEISPHTLRATYATHMLNGGADIRVIQELLGHSSILTTQVYLAISLKQVEASFKKHHPRYKERA